MLVKIDKNNEFIDTEKLKPIDSGEDGTIYVYNNFILKILHSNYMTINKSNDLNKAVPSNSRLIVPRAKIWDESNRFRGYLSKLVDSNEGIINMTVDEYLEQMNLLEEEIHRYFSENEIAITDTNPRNVLSSTINGKETLFLIDHDRDITKSSLLCDKERIINGNYYKYNKKKMSLLKYKVLLLQILYLAQKTNQEKDILSYIKTGCKKATINSNISEEELNNYDTISDYAQNTLKNIKKK